MSKKWIVVFAALAVGAAGAMVASPTTVLAQPAKEKDKAAPEKMKKEPSEKQKAYIAFMRECRKKK